MNKTLHLMIEGRVQGVGYRQWFAREAMVLGLTGWVRNRTNGKVEATVSGSDEDVEQLVAVARRGPRLALVSKIDAQTASDENWPDFSIHPTL